MLILPDPNPHHLGFEAFSSRIALKCVLSFKSDSDLKVNWKLVLMNLEVGFNELLCVSRFTFRTNSAREAAFRSKLRPSVRTEAVFQRPSSSGSMSMWQRYRCLINVSAFLSDFLWSPLKILQFGPNSRRFSSMVEFFVTMSLSRFKMRSLEYSCTCYYFFVCILSHLKIPNIFSCYSTKQSPSQPFSQ